MTTSESAIVAPDPAPEPSPARLVVVQGPVQALAACAAVVHAERLWGARYRNVLLLGSFLSDDEHEHYHVVREATLGCAVAVKWDRVLDLGQVPDTPALRAAVGEPVAEVICARNWQAVNELALSTFPDAYRIVVGDGLGVIDPDRDPRLPQFHLAMPVIPQPLLKDSLQDTRLEVVPRERLREMVQLARRASPRLCSIDERLAEFARGGLLLLMSFRTESHQATLRGEIQLAAEIVKSCTGSPEAPVLIKPHPRSSLGQAAAVARRLRALGHRVRIMSAPECGHYPIELFEKLLGAVDQVQAQGSSSALSMSLLYRVKATADLPRPVARQAFLPRDRASSLCGAAWVQSSVEALEDWDRKSALPAPQPVFPTRWAKVRGRLARPITWAPALARRERRRRWRVPSLPTPLLARLGDAAPLVVHDPTARLTWLIGGQDPDSSGRGRARVGTESPKQAVLTTLTELETGCRFCAVLAAVPRSYAPGWQRWWGKLARVPVVDGAALTAEQLEDLLETRADIELRLPEIGLSPRESLRARVGWSPPPGFVVFVGCVR